MSPGQNTLAPSFTRPESRVAIVKCAGYDADLGASIFEALKEFDLPVAGKRVLLKPNLVGSDPESGASTHPAVIAAARDSFLRLGALEVMIGEGPALERDVEGLAESLGLREHLGRLDSFFVDLNTDDVSRVPLKTRASSLGELHLPNSVLRADLVVSMPKLKTHHWAGVTLSLKNMFGIVPGRCYGWPKNLLHYAGITKSVLDINSTVRPHFAIVDGVVGMEGNGPLQGTPKHAGVLVLGDDPVAVDATCARVMGLVPERIEHIAQAGVMLGHVKENKIRQMGDAVAGVRTPFEVLGEFARIRAEG